MPLTKCPECNESVADRAPTCPHCGCPIAGSPLTPAPSRQIVTIERTSKRYKAMQGIVSLIFLIGIYMFVTGWMQDSPSRIVYGLLGILVYPVGMFWIKCLIWWHHG